MPGSTFRPLRTVAAHPSRPRPRFSSGAWCVALRTAVSHRWRPVVPLEPFGVQPRRYQQWTIGAFAVALIGIAVACRRLDPPATALVALVCLLDTALIPIVRNPAGGIKSFNTPLVLGTGLLYNSATAFVGVTLGYGVGHTLFHRREFWRGIPNGLMLGVGVAAGAAVVARLRAGLPLAAAIAIAPTALVVIYRVTNIAFMATMGYARWGLSPWRHFVGRIQHGVAEQLMDTFWLLPVTAGTVLLPHDRWWILLIASMPLNVVNALFMLHSYPWTRAGRVGIGDTLLQTDDARLRAIAAHLSQGAALTDPDGRVFIITPGALALCALPKVPAGTRLHDLFVPEDVPCLDQLLEDVRRRGGSRAAELRVRASDGRRNWVFVTVVDQLANDALRGLVVTMHEVADEHRRWRALAEYADRTFAAPLVDALEAQRRAFGQEIDFSIRQILALLQLAVERPDGTGGPSPRDLVGRALRAARSIQRRLAPPELEDLGLVAAIRSHAEDLHEDGLLVDVETAFDGRVRFGRDVELVAYRVVQWALDNVVRHAGVDRAVVQLLTYGARLRIIVTDHGRGFDPDRIPKPGGLTQIEGRVRLAGGTAQVRSAVGRGTQVVVELPITAPMRDGAASSP